MEALIKDKEGLEGKVVVLREEKESLRLEADRLKLQLDTMVVQVRRRREEDS